MAGKPGRPSKYRPEFDELAYKFCLLGATDERLAQLLEVSQRTIDAWKQEYPDFAEALRRGKAIADAEVAQSLYRRATGFSHPDVHVSNYQGEITVTPLTKHYPPDVTACIFWLKNRERGNWRNSENAETDAAGKVSAIILGDDDAK